MNIHKMWKELKVQSELQEETAAAQSPTVKSNSNFVVAEFITGLLCNAALDYADVPNNKVARECASTCT